MPEEQVPQSTEDFVLYFVTKYEKLIYKIARRYAIPNRYEKDDIKQYITERIIAIMTKRDTDNVILNPEKYFRSCLEFYCIEYQRMHGFIFDLPKRPRRNCEQDEKNIRSLGFKYIEDLNTEEINNLYIEDKLEYDIINNPAWSFLTGLVSAEEAKILECVFVKNMTWSETNKALDVPQSTCWFRNNRALEKIKIKIENYSGEFSNKIRNILRHGDEEGIIRS